MKYDVIDMKSVAKALNNATYTDYFYSLTLLARSLYKWEGLPNEINEKWIEKYLFLNGECMFFKDDILGFMVAKCSESGLNFYDEPINLMPTATNYSNPKFYKNGDDAVLICNNDLRIATKHKIELFALRLAEITRAIDVNINAHKTPILLTCSEKQRLTLKNVYAQYTGNEPVIYGDKSLDFNSINAIKTDAPVVFDKLQIQKHAIWNELMTFLGVNNANMDKRERLVDDEVQANNQQVSIFGDTMLKARQDACDKINKIFGLNIKVSLRNDLNEFLEGFKQDLINHKGDEENPSKNVKEVV